MRWLLLILMAQSLQVFAQVNKATQTLLVRTHNDLRRSVPGAANMLEMSWDRGLAGNALTYAKRCRHGHSGDMSTGQNFGVQAGNKPWNAREIVNYWFSRRRFAPVGVYKNYQKQTTDISAYTQVVWAKSNKLGCAVHKCNKPTLKGWFWVCYYKQRGNQIGQPVFVSGPHCSRCPGGGRCKNGLCQATTGCVDNNGGCRFWKNINCREQWTYDNCRRTCGFC